MEALGEDRSKNLIGYIGMNSHISLLKIVATLIVFICHCYVICKAQFGFQFTESWQFFLNTPAWGGVWIFFVISGFLAAKGFITNKYQTDTKSILLYYKQRVIKIWLPAIVFISLGYILWDPTHELTLKQVLRYLTCTMNGPGGPRNTGASWYIFIIMWLYFLTPWLIRFYRQYVSGKRTKQSYFVLLVAVATIGLLYRFACLDLHLDWYDYVYANVFGCLDLYVAGMIVCKIVTTYGNSIRLGICSVVFLGCLILFNCALTSLIGKNLHPTFIYRYLLPTVYLFATSLFLLSYGGKTQKQLKYSKVINTVSLYTLTFYLWHSVVFYNLTEAIYLTNDFMRYLCILGLGFIITGYISFLMTKLNNAVFK